MTKEKTTMSGKYLITTDSWFIGPDGSQYRGAWGEVTIIEDTFLGLKTNRNSTNWFAKVGSEEKHVIIAGCQIHYSVKTDKKPNTEFADDYVINDGKCALLKRPNIIYIAE